MQRLATVDLVAAQPGVRVVWHGETLHDFLVWRADSPVHLHPRLLMLDLHVDRGPVVEPESVRALVADGVAVLVFSAMGDPDQLRAVLRAGASGVLGKRDSEANVVAAMWAVLARRRWMTRELEALRSEPARRPVLSEQERQALVLYASGNTLRAVAETLGVQLNTAKKYLSRVKRKYADVGRPVRTKVELNAAARRDGLLDETPDVPGPHSTPPDP
ncbi:hypothetical protein GCM10009668_14190 [Nocardioides dubius]|uniref:DNA-binding response regulator, NarL/FixJ family, contains REC and HTH domains n=1 Tax=Nocardioides dubius TaxID=317019 RepID=A0ABN1TQF2_9ACTN